MSCLPPFLVEMPWSWHRHSLKSVTVRFRFPCSCKRLLGLPQGIWPCLLLLISPAFWNIVLSLCLSSPFTFPPIVPTKLVHTSTRHCSILLLAQDVAGLPWRQLHTSVCLWNRPVDGPLNTEPLQWHSNLHHYKLEPSVMRCHPQGFFLVVLIQSMQILFKYQFLCSYRWSLCPLYPFALSSGLGHILRSLRQTLSRSLCFACACYFHLRPRSEHGQWPY